MGKHPNGKKNNEVAPIKPFGTVPDDTGRLALPPAEIQQTFIEESSSTVGEPTRSVGCNAGQLHARLARVQQILTEGGWSDEVSQSLPWGAVRGLPERGDLFKLARVYLETQRKLWPELVDTQILPEAKDEEVARLAGEFVIHFLDKRVHPYQPPAGSAAAQSGFSETFGVFCKILPGNEVT